MRASYSERLTTRQRQTGGRGAGAGEHYKSNSSLDLDHELDILQESSVITDMSHHPGNRRDREYGSHGSLDMMGIFKQVKYFSVKYF